MKFSLQSLRTQFDTLPDLAAKHNPTGSGINPGTTLYLALSGGMDSMVLLHGILALRDAEGYNFPQNIKAIHINHGLHADASNWQQHCLSACQASSVPLLIRSVNLTSAAGDDENSIAGGIEEKARKARYQVFNEFVGPNDCLLTAHHFDDQTETLLLRLMRGAGPEGLAAIPACRALEKGVVFRPLLPFYRTELQQYAQQHSIHWIDDPSNGDSAFDRNYCRHQILPLIEKRWPAFRKSWAKTLRLNLESAQLVEELAGDDLSQLMTSKRNAIQLAGLRTLSSARRRNVLRHWLRGLGIGEVSWSLLQRLDTDIASFELASKTTEASPSIHIEHGSLAFYAYREQLHVVTRLAEIDPTASYSWPSLSLQLNLPDNGSLSVEYASGLLPVETSLEVRFRQGGERVRLRGRPQKTVKKLLQESNYVPWLRSRVPLLYSKDTLVCIPGIGIAQDIEQELNPILETVCWVPPNVDCG